MNLVEILVAAVVLGERDAVKLVTELLGSVKLVDLTEDQAAVLARVFRRDQASGL